MENALSIIAIAISIASVIITFYTFIWTLNRDRKKSTFDAFNLLQNEVFDKINLLSKTDVKNIAKNPKDSKFTEYSQYLARIEQFCVGVGSKIYDYKITSKIAKNYLRNIFEKSWPVIEKKRIIYPNEPQCVEFQKLVSKTNFKNDLDR